MDKAVFLDRDGTINEDVGLLHESEKIKLLPGVPEAIKLLNKLNFFCVIVTNQPVVARGLCEEDDVKRINEIIKT